jgi:hypothetical protein
VADDLEILFADRDNVVARRDRLLVQYRRGPLTLEVIDRIGTDASLLRAGLAGRKTALLAVVAEGAPSNPPEVRERLRELIRSFAEHPGTRIALVIEGDGMSALAMRTITRGVLLGQPRLRAGRTVVEVAPWLAEHLGIAAADVVAIAAQVRETKPPSSR